MRPPDSVVWAVRIDLRVAMRMMMPMVRTPLDGVSLDGEGTKSGKCILDCFRRLEAFVGELAMEGGSDAERCQNVAPEAELEHLRAVAEWGTESHNVGACDDSGHDLVFPVHLRPVFVHSWKDFEAPEFVITEWTQFWNFEFWPCLSLIFLPHDVGDS